jgi:hypothetical protein
MYLIEIRIIDIVSVISPPQRESGCTIRITDISRARFQQSEWWWSRHTQSGRYLLITTTMSQSLCADSHGCGSQDITRRLSVVVDHIFLITLMVALAANFQWRSEKDEPPSAAYKSRSAVG